MQCNYITLLPDVAPCRAWLLESLSQPATLTKKSCINACRSECVSGGSMLSSCTAPEWLNTLSHMMTCRVSCNLLTLILWNGASTQKCPYGLRAGYLQENSDCFWPTSVTSRK